MRKAVLAFALAFVTLPTAACIDDKGEEDEIPGEDGKADSFYHPTDHGAIAWSTPGFAELTDAEHHHTWTFALSADAQVDLTTSYAVLGQRRTDTVLYLYKWNGASWGPYIARNDDYGSTTYSQLIKSLGAGEYRALVKGYLATTHGKFKLTVGCTGAGCEPPAPPAGTCLFGSTYNDIPGNPSLQVLNSNRITAANVDTLTAIDQQHLVVAVQQSSHTDVTTVAEALAAVDQGEVNVTWLAEPAARRTFIAFEYGAGDNSYGAIFSRTDDSMVSKIHDGDLEACTVSAETCLLPEDYSMLRHDPQFVLATDRAITSANQVNAAESAQLLDTLTRIYGVTTVADGISRADDDTVNLRTYTYTPTSAALTVVELGAGDTSVGTVYYGTTTTRAGTIEDLFITSCTLFADE